MHEGALPSRPEYSWLEAQINARHPSPRWARSSPGGRGGAACSLARSPRSASLVRQLSRVDEEGLRFMRRGEEESGGATEREAPQSESER